MKLIVAIVRPLVLERLMVALEDVEGFPGFTVSDSAGFGLRVKTSDDALNPLKTNKRIEIVADDEMVDEVITVIQEHAHTGRKGDGIITVLPVDEIKLI